MTNPKVAMEKLETAARNLVKHWDEFGILANLEEDWESVRNCLNALNGMSPCSKHERRFWVEVITPDPDHSDSDNPNHVSVASYCAMCVNERLTEENRRLTLEISDSDTERAEHFIIENSSSPIETSICCPSCKRGTIPVPRLSIGASRIVKCSTCGIGHNFYGGDG